MTEAIFIFDIVATGLNIWIAFSRRSWINAGCAAIMIALAFIPASTLYSNYRADYTTSTRKGNLMAKHTPEQIRDISEAVYRIRLNQDTPHKSDDNPGNVARMLAKDNDGGKKLRARAGSYDVLTRAYLDVLGVKPT